MFIMLVAVIHLGDCEQVLTQVLPLLLAEAVERVEVGIVELYDGLVDYHVLNLRRRVVALED